MKNWGRRSASLLDKGTGLSLLQVGAFYIRSWKRSQIWENSQSRNSFGFCDLSLDSCIRPWMFEHTVSLWISSTFYRLDLIIGWALSKDPLVSQNALSSRVHWGQAKQDVFTWGLECWVPSNGIEYNSGVSPKVWNTGSPFLKEKERGHIPTWKAWGQLSEATFMSAYLQRKYSSFP